MSYREKYLESKKLYQQYKSKLLKVVIIKNAVLTELSKNGRRRSNGFSDDIVFPKIDYEAIAEQIAYNERVKLYRKEVLESRRVRDDDEKGYS